MLLTFFILGVNVFYIYGATYRSADITDNIFVVFNSKPFDRFLCLLQLSIAVCFQSFYHPFHLKFCYRIFTWKKSASDEYKPFSRHFSIAARKETSKQIQHSSKCFHYLNYSN